MPQSVSILDKIFKKFLVVLKNYFSTTINISLTTIKIAKEMSPHIREAHQFFHLVHNIYTSIYSLFNWEKHVRMHILKLLQIYLDLLPYEKVLRPYYISTK